MVPRHDPGMGRSQVGPIIRLISKVVKRVHQHACIINYMSATK